jgi:hypothetical protein
MRFVLLVGLGVIGCNSVTAGHHPDGGPSSDAREDATLAADADLPDANPCAPTASCPAVEPACLGLIDNTGKSVFGLRIGEIDFSSPDAFAAGVVQTTIANAVELNLPTCDLNGTGQANWLLQLDTGQDRLSVGNALPVADPTQGYVFDSTNPPATSNIVPTGSTFTSGLISMVTLPIYENSSGSSILVNIPFRQVLVSGTLSANQDCVGSYNLAGLDPSNSCMGSPLFLSGGTLVGEISLEDADANIVSALNESLCVLLSGNSTTYGDGGSPVHCKRDSSTNAINFHGDWCLATNNGATTTCYDAVQVHATYAASSVKIN